MTIARIPSLDGLRFIAILMVVISHLSGSPGFISLPWITSEILGETGVRIFFVLSGFLITALLLAEHAKSGRIRLGRFFIRRCFRIFPAFYLYLSLLALAWALGWIVLQSGDLLKAAAYIVDYCEWDSTSNFVRHIWSLSVEEQFYLIWPAAIWVFGPRRAKWIAIASILGSPIWRSAIPSYFPEGESTLDRRFDALTDSLATGCLLAFVQAGLSRSVRYRVVISSAWAYLLPVVVIGAASLAEYPLADRLLGTSIANIGIALFMHRCILFPPAWLNMRVPRTIGVMSYSIYLWQQAFCSLHFGSPRLPVYVAVPLTLVFAGASFYGVEQPLQRLGRRLSDRDRRGSSPL